MPDLDAQSRDASIHDRHETATERADRNWNEVLQELRVLQTGTQILTGFLLALAFQPAFSDLTAGQRVFYLVLVLLSALSAIIALAPVALHRVLFRQGAKALVVRFGHVGLLTALTIVALLLAGVVAFVFDVVVGTGAATVAAAALVLLIIVLWAVLPAVFRAHHRRREPSGDRETER